MNRFYLKSLFSLLIWVIANVSIASTPPVAINDTLVTEEDVPVVVPSIEDNNDYAPDGTIVTLDTTGMIAALHGELEITNLILSSVMIYTPDEDFTGVDSFQYYIEDNAGDRDTAWVIITVNNINDAPIAINDTVSINEDSLAYIPVVDDNDVDIDGTIASVDTGLNLTGSLSGSVVIVGDSLLYTPDPNYYGVDRFQYIAIDNEGGKDTAWVIVEVLSVNDLPNAVNDTVVTDEDLAINIPVVDNNDTDVDGFISHVYIAGVIAPLHGNIVVSGTSIDYAPSANYAGADSFQYIAMDNHGTRDTAWVFVDVTELNDPPVAVVDSLETDEDTPVLIPVIADNNDYDLDGTVVDMSFVGVTGPTNGVVDDTELILSSIIIYTPNANFNGIDSLQYVITDDDGAKDTTWIYITVNSVNDKPVVGNSRLSLNEDAALRIPHNASDIDGTIASVITTGLPAPIHGSVVIDNDTLVYTPTANYYGTDRFEYAVVDNEGAKDTAWVLVTIHDVNDLPVAIDDAVSIDEDSTVTIAVVDANDSDADGSIISLDTTGVIGALHGLVVIDNDSLIYSPLADFNGKDSLQYVIMDNDGGKDTAWVVITINDINDAPLALDDAATTDEDTPVIILVVDANDSDVDGTIVSIDTTGLASAINGAIVIDNDSLIYTPNANYNGKDSLQYMVTDDDGASDTAWVVITVTSINDLPFAVDDNAITDEDVAVSIAVVDANDSDADGSIVAISLTGVTTALNGAAMIAGDSIVYTPGADFNGEDSLEYIIIDNDGGQDTAWVFITINDVNDAPFALDDAATTDEDTPVIIPVVDANDSDVDGTIVSIDTTGLASAINGAVVIDNDSLIYTPNANYNGKDSLQYMITDDDGASDTAWVVITVTSINDLPLAVDDNATTDEDVAVSIAVVDANDSDADGSIVAISLTGVTTALHGTGMIAGDSIVYTPGADFNGEDSLEYIIIDNDGGKDTAWVFITINDVNDAPLALDDAATTDEDIPVIIPVVDANDADADGTIVSIDTTGLASAINGVVIIDNDSLIYTPNTNYNGKDSLQYKAIDNDGASDTAWVVITIGDINDAPFAVNDTFETDEDVALNISVATNDIDADGSLASIDNAGLAAPLNGDITINALTIIYTPDADYYGKDSFEYLVMDDDGATDTAMVFVTIASVNDAPIANDDNVAFNFVVAQDVIFDNVVANDDDIDDNLDSSSVQFVNPSSGVKVDSIIITGEGKWTFDSATYAVVFSPDSAFTVEPTPMEYVIYDLDGSVSSVATLTVTYVTYSITYNGNGAESSVPFDDAEYVEGYGVVVQDMIPLREGYMFRGWTATLTSGLDTIQPEELFLMPQGDLTLTALWELIVVDQAFIPNAFTPNGDNINDYYVIPWLEELGEVIHLRVFNQWGDLVYENENYDNMWNGDSNQNTMLGNELPVGTYFYTLKVGDDAESIRQGYIYIKR